VTTPTDPGIYFRQIPEDPGNPYRTGRNVKHDARSRNFAAVDEWPEPESLDVEVEWPVMIGVLDQGDLGSCTGNGGTADEGTSDEAGDGYLVDPLTKAELDQLYAVQLYSDATAIDQWQGSYPPDDTGSDGLSICKVLLRRGLIDRYTHIFGIDHAKIAIQHGGFLVGTNWYRSMFFPDARGVVSITATSFISGGHLWFMRGRKRYFQHLGDDRWYWKARNSWGGSFADGGDFYLLDETLDRLLREEGDAQFLHWTHRKAAPEPTPEPPPFPSTPSGCLGQMVSKFTRGRSAGGRG
jgi:hypothetical protein